MIYSDYDFYCYGPYQGTLSVEDFRRLVIRASSFLDYFTQGKAEEYSNLEAVKMACCALTDQYKLLEDAQELARKNVNAALSDDGPEMQSETVGSYSRTLRSGGDSAAAAMKAAAEARKAIPEIAREYLAHTGLLYRGRCFDCTPHTL